MKRRAVAPTGLAYAAVHEVEGSRRWLFEIEAVAAV